MKVLVLGAKGMLGQEIVNVYSDHEVLAWDRDDCDVTKFDEAAQKILEAKPDLIFNCVAYNNVDGAEDRGDGEGLAVALNAYVPEHLAMTARDLGVPFVHFSTDYVFGGEESPEGFTESAEPNPINVYGQTKLDGERAVLREYADGSYISRLSRLFGKKASSAQAKESCVGVMLRLAGGKDHLDLVNEEVTCPTYAVDLAQRARYIVENKPADLYHAVNTGGCTWHELAMEAFKLRGVEIDVAAVSGDKFPRPAKRPAHSILLNTKVVPPMRSWQEALAEYLNDTPPSATANTSPTLGEEGPLKPKSS